jgi:hypothetical protein
VWPKSYKCGMRIQQGEQDVAEAQFDLKGRARSMPGASRQFPSFQVFSSKPLSTSLCTAFQKDTSIIAMQKLKQGQRTHDFLDQPQPLGRGGCMVF